METRQVLLVDAFADEPMGGRPVAVVPDGVDLSRNQLRAIALELGVGGAVTRRDRGIEYVGRASSHAVVEAAIAGAAGLFERGAIETGTHTLVADGVEYSTEVQDDGQVWIELLRQELKEPAVTHEEVATALGIDVAALHDVGADLPLVRVAAHGGSLLAPVNFLEHLGRADPEPSALTELLETTDTRRLFAFTFDTLSPDAGAHARTFETCATGCERVTSGVAVAGCGAHLARHDVFDTGAGEMRVECGHFLDRPATVVSTLEDAPRIGASGVTVLDGEITVPDESDDDIIEV